MFSLIDHFPPLLGSGTGGGRIVRSDPEARDKFGAFTLLTDRIDQ
jgi:hypothetical protein